MLRSVEGELPTTSALGYRLCSRFLDQLYNQGMDEREPDLTRWLLAQRISDVTRMLQSVAQLVNT